MLQPVVLVAEELAPSALAVLADDFEVRHVDGADRTALLPALADVDAVIVRSATMIDAEALAAASRLKVVARAGVGLDNVDVAAATARGVLVVNAPTSNIVSAAEHAVALLLSVARRVPQASASLRAGEWKRSKFTGVEITDKTVGVVGLGRIGVLFAQRMSAFGTRLFGYDNVVAPPHLGASTAEAQDKAGTAVARSVLLALQGEFVPDAVNVQAGGVVAEEVKPGLPLAEKLGRVFTALAGGVATRLTVEVRGEIAAYDVSVLQLSALKGAFADVVEDPVTFVNAPLHAAERGVELGLVTSEESPEYRNLITVRGTLATGEEVSVSGTLSGPRHIEKLVEVDGFDIDVVPTQHLAFLRYSDRAGVVGVVGQVLGDAA